MSTCTFTYSLRGVRVIVVALALVLFLSLVLGADGAKAVVELKTEATISAWHSFRAPVAIS